VKTQNQNKADVGAPDAKKKRKSKKTSKSETWGEGRHRIRKGRSPAEKKKRAGDKLIGLDAKKGKKKRPGERACYNENEGKRNND